jgi:DNA end-binding protein Ku
LSQSRKVAVARIVMRTKEYLAVVRPIGDALCLETLRYADEVVAAEEVGGIPEDFEIGERELAMADQLIEHLTAKFDPGEFKDEYRERLLQLIDAKASGEDLVVQEPSDRGAKGNVINLMEALKKSLESVPGQAEAKTQRGKDAKGPVARSRASGGSGAAAKKKTAKTAAKPVAKTTKRRAA